MATLAHTAAARSKTNWRRLAPMLLSRALLYAFLILCAVVFVFPFYTMFVGSFMTDAALFSRDPQFWPKNGINVESYRQLFLEIGFGRPLFNSFYLALVRTLGALFFCSLAGFVFAKRHFPGRDKLFVFMLITMMLPGQITLIPWYLLMVKTFHWADTYWPFWLPEWAYAFGIFWMRQYIASTIPDEMLEAAAIDGATLFGSFMRIVLPLIAPGMAVLGILNFVEGFNQFLGPLLILTDPARITAPLALANFKGTTVIAPRYSLMFAGSTLATLPLLVVFFAFQKQLVSGIMSGAVKG
ncbi:MAG: carbohydrate ABC transporter permease [Caldilineaceae bacterium]|nr:carbohydrate ABC transporter permease [Caldilineaceae bacterium]